MSDASRRARRSAADKDVAFASTHLRLIGPWLSHLQSVHEHGIPERVLDVDDRVSAHVATFAAMPGYHPAYRIA